MTLLNLFMPARCLVCSTPYAYESGTLREFTANAPLCPECRSAAAPMHHPNRCPRCSIPLPQLVGECERCRREDFAFDRVIAVQRYSGVPASIVQEYKFGLRHSLARFIGRMMVPLILANASQETPLIPVPSRRQSVRRRGFSGAALIAHEAARLSGYPLLHLLKARTTHSQKSLSYLDRRSNAASAISRSHDGPSPPHVVLIDDVLTTGTTADSCARILKDAGARSVVVVTYALEY